MHPFPYARACVRHAPTLRHGVVYLLIIGALALAAALLLPNLTLSAARFATGGSDYLDLARSRRVDQPPMKSRLASAMPSTESTRRAVEIAGTYVTEGVGNVIQLLGFFRG